MPLGLPQTLTFRSSAPLRSMASPRLILLAHLPPERLPLEDSCPGYLLFPLPYLFNLPPQADIEVGVSSIRESVLPPRHVIPNHFYGRESQWGYVVYSFELPEIKHIRNTTFLTSSSSHGQRYCWLAVFSSTNRCPWERAWRVERGTSPWSARAQDECGKS
jgi:hypothetical protein